MQGGEFPSCPAASPHPYARETAAGSGPPRAAPGPFPWRRREKTPGRIASAAAGWPRRRDDGQQGEKDNVYWDIEAIVGGAGNDSITASSGPNTIIGNDGNDTIYAQLGNDLIAAGNGDDRVYALGGDDTVAAGSGNDCVIGGKGADVLTGNDDNDT